LKRGKEKGMGLNWSEMNEKKEQGNLTEREGGWDDFRRRSGNGATNEIGKKKKNTEKKRERKKRGRVAMFLTNPATGKTTTRPSTDCLQRGRTLEKWLGGSQKKEKQQKGVRERRANKRQSGKLKKFNWDGCEGLRLRRRGVRIRRGQRRG